MRVFITGASGFVGSAIVEELLSAGHEVLGLARSDASAKALRAAGADVLRGSLEEIDKLRQGAAEADGVIHTAFVHDFSRFAECCAIDRRAIEAVGAELEGSDRPFIVTSGAVIAANGRTATEDDPHVPVTDSYPRASEAASDELRERGIKVATMLLPHSVHGTGDHGFVPILIGMAREKGVSAYIGDGSNVWPAVHRPDAAKAYRLAIEDRAVLPHYHAIAEEGVPFREIAEVIGRYLGVSAIGMTSEDAAEHFTWFTQFAATNAPTSSDKTRKRLGWGPTGPGLIADIETAGYFGA